MFLSETHEYPSTTNPKAKQILKCEARRNTGKQREIGKPFFPKNGAKKLKSSELRFQNVATHPAQVSFPLKQGTNCKVTTLQSYLGDPQGTKVFYLNNC